MNPVEADKLKLLGEPMPTPESNPDEAVRAAALRSTGKRCTTCGGIFPPTYFDDSGDCLDCAAPVGRYRRMEVGGGRAR